ncbi:unnamed protein product [Closterium sp. NIES-54]
MVGVGEEVIVGVAVVGAVEVTEAEVVEVEGLVEVGRVVAAARVAVKVELAGGQVRELRLGAQLVGAEVLELDSSSRIGRRRSRRISYKNGWHSEAAMGEEVAAVTSGARVLVQETSAASRAILRLAASTVARMLFARGLVRRRRCLTG